MGVPKFYKWLSERYPLINQVASNEIRPEFGTTHDTHERHNTEDNEQTRRMISQHGASLFL